MPRPPVRGPIRTERVIYGRRDGHGRRQIVAARIGAPEVGPAGSWQCRIQYPAVVGRDTWIVGADPGQARALAAEFVALMFEHRGYLLAPRLRKALARRARSTSRGTG